MKHDVINNINLAIADFFRRNPSVTKIPAKDLMPLFIRNGIFPNDHKSGLPIRNLLRNLGESKELNLISYVLAERKSKNTSWYFIPSKIVCTQVILRKPGYLTILDRRRLTTHSAGEEYRAFHFYSMVRMNVSIVFNGQFIPV